MIKKENPTAYKILFQKNINGDIVGRVVIITTEDIALSKQYQTKSFDKIYLFDDFKGNRKSSWVGLGNNVFSEVFKTNTANENATLAINKKSATTSIGLNGSGCSIFTSTTSEPDCWHTPGGDTYDMTCGYVTGRTVIFTICGSNGGGGDESIDYSGFLGTSGSGTGSSTTNNLTLIDSLNAFNSKISDSLHPCLDSILQKLKGLDSGKVAAIIKKFSGSAPDWNWNIIEGVLGTNINGQTLSQISNGTVTTVLDYGKLSKATDLSAARTIIHESVHAYLVAYFRYDYDNANKDYPNMVKAWYASRNHDLNSIQHDQMIKSFIEDISQALELFGKSQGYNIDKYIYDDLAWGGLDFQNNSQLSDEQKDRILNRLKAEQYNSKYGDEYPSGTKACK